MDDAAPLALPFPGLAAAAAAATAFCCLCALWAVRSSPKKRGPTKPNPKKKKKKQKPCGCTCGCGERSRIGVGGGGGGAGDDLANGDPGVGASMMEQLVPEIRMHALSYLDYPSLCRLSMTNSWMRRAANDDNAWKALYRKDFTVEQDSVTPINGWKSYYAATKAIINVNTEFYNIIRERSLPAMSRFWLHAEYVKCIHSSGELFTGFSAVMDSWALAFNWDQGGQGVPSQFRDVRVRVVSDMAWVTMKAGVDAELWPYYVTNIYEFHNGRWHMVLHHASGMLEMDVGVIEA